MAPLTHGTRRTYQDHGCRCALCRADNTAYGRRYRALVQAGRPPLGAHVAGREGRRLVKLLVEHGWTRAQIATALGYRWPRLRCRAVMTHRTLCRLRRLARTWTA